MSKITLFDGNEIIITPNQAAALELSLSEDKDGWVKINDMTVKKASISSILPGGYTESDLPYHPAGKQLSSGKVCHGQFSIQREINNIAKASGAGWAKRVKDRVWREATRKKLQATTNEWCDAKARSCHCE